MAPLTDDPAASAAPRPVLILIHGATLNSHMWDAVRRHLDPRLQVLAPDLPGHGTRRGERFTMEAAVATITAAARSVAPAPVLLVGDSLGGYTALAAASALPAAQLKGLVVGGCSANLIGLRARLPFIAKATMFRLLLALMGEEKLIGRTVAKVRDMLAGAQVPQADIDALVAAGFSLRPFSEAVDALTGVDYRAKLAAIAQPVLIVNGDRDTVMVRQEPSFLSAARCGSSHRFGGCEHGVSLLRSGEFAGLVNGVVGRAAARA